MSSVVKIDPEIMSGAPCFAGTHVPIQNLIDYVEGGEVKVETRSFPDSLVAALATLPSMSLVPSAPFSSTSVSIA
jgi:hypothetical protein